MSKSGNRRSAGHPSLAAWIESTGFPSTSYGFQPTTDIRSRRHGFPEGTHTALHDPRQRAPEWTPDSLIDAVSIPGRGSAAPANGPPFRYR